MYLSYKIGGFCPTVRVDWRWGGRGKCLGAGKNEARKMLINRVREVPQRPVRALLGAAYFTTCLSEIANTLFLFRFLSFLVALFAKSLQ